MKRHTTLVECEHCGHQQHAPRTSRYGEDMFLELWHEHMDLQAEVKRLRAIEVEHAKLQDDLRWWQEHAAWLSARLRPLPLEKRRSPFDEIEKAA